MIRWIREIWVPYILSKGGRGSILCLYSFRVHLTDRVITEFRQKRIHEAVIHGGCTSVIQLLDVSLNKPFKSLLRAQWQQYILEETEKAEVEKGEKLPAPTNQLMIDTHGRKCVKRPQVLSNHFSNTNGTWEERLFRDDNLRVKIEEDMQLVFGSGQLASCNFDSEDSDDPLDTDESECDSGSEL